MISGVYQILNTVSGDFYIGSSVNVKGRKATHFSKLGQGKHHSIVLQRAFNKYGQDSFKFQILECVQAAKLIEVEQQYLDVFKPKYNISPTAKNCLGVKHSKESSALKSKNHTSKGKFGKDNTSSKEIYQYDLDGNFVKTWYGSPEIERALGYNQENIRGCCYGDRTSYGFIWRRKYEGTKMINPPKRRCRDAVCKTVGQFDCDGNLLRTFKSIREASYFIKQRPDTAISWALRKSKNHKAYGFIWKYI